MTPGQMSYFGDIASTPSGVEAPATGVQPPASGVRLPSDSLGGVSARDWLYAASINAASIQGIAFGDLLAGGNTLIPADSILGTADEGRHQLLLALAVNPATRKPFARILAPTGTMQAEIPAGGTAALFVGTAARKSFGARGLLLTNESATPGPLTALATYSSPANRVYPIVNQLSFQGDGGSVRTGLLVQNITSTGPLGDVRLWLGKAEVLQSLTAPSLFGTVNLYGGTLAGTLQTTGVSTDNSGQRHAVSADLGSADRPTELDLRMARGSRVVSRGNLFSDVKITGPLNGDIAAAGDIGQSLPNGRRAGGIAATGTGTSSGRIITLGAIHGDVSIANEFAGTIASQGDIDANVTLANGLARQGQILGGGNIGDATAGTRLSIAHAADGAILAAGKVILVQSKNPSKHRKVGSAKVGSAQGGVQAGSSALDGLFGPTLDSAANTLDLAGLSRIEQNLANLRAA